MKMLESLSHHLLLPFLILVFIASPSPSSGDLGTTSHYGPPYYPTACFGNDLSQFPLNKYFAAAGEEIWDNGAACGRMYWVKCISSYFPKTTCTEGEMIEVQIVDRAQTSVSPPTWPGTKMALSGPAFTAIAGLPVAWVQIEYKQK
ncbi:PREDICTED: EG45-like domain containing protein [Ipomoea nil]|uniref:EG45-like domain containing protein n=1 Tax=Ipomoea nil TaxID=35883 RepID=UPI000900E46D|nr:PREDICTED: EG45-like domain containing protein [Ipomoea nil]